ncbi:MAG: MFS transporter, partial [Actinomycetota bacterium]
IKQSAIPAGALLAGVAVPTLGLTVGWRWAFAGAAVLAVASTILIPDQQPTAPPAVRSDPSLPSTDAPTWITLCFAVGAVFAAGTAGVLGAFLVSGAVDIGIADSAAGLLAATASAVSIVTRLLLGVRADRRGSGHLLVVAGMLIAGSAAFALLATGRVPLFVLAAPLAFGLSWSWPGLFNLSMVRHHPQAPGAATGITQTGIYIGAVTGPFLFGVVADGGYGGAWAMAGCWSVIAGLLMGGSRTILIRHRRARAEETT